MLRDALALRAENGWLQTVASLSLPSVKELECMSMRKLQQDLDVSQPIAELLFGFCRQKCGPFTLQSIQEEASLPRRRRNIYGRITTQQRPPQGRVMHEAPCLNLSDEVDCVSEFFAKQRTKLAGPKRVRNSLCNFKQVTVVDRNPKWASKRQTQRMRARDRDEKTYRQQER